MLHIVTHMIQYRGKQPLPITAYMKNKLMKHSPYIHEDLFDTVDIKAKSVTPAKLYKELHRNCSKKNPTKTFIGGVVIGTLATLAVLYIIFPLADYLTDTLLAYLMK